MGHVVKVSPYALLHFLQIFKDLGHQWQPFLFGSIGFRQLGQKIINGLGVWQVSQKIASFVLNVEQVRHCHLFDPSSSYFTTIGSISIYFDPKLFIHMQLRTILLSIGQKYFFSIFDLSFT